MTIQSNYNNRSVSGWSMTQLYQYFCSWFRATNSAPQYPTNAGAAYYNLGMQSQWQNLYQPAAETPDPETLRQNEIQAKIGIEQNRSDEIDEALNSINEDPNAKNVVDNIRRYMTQPPQPTVNPAWQGLGIGGGGYNNLASLPGMMGSGMNVFSTYVNTEQFDDVLTQYAYVYQGKVSVDGEGFVTPQDSGKALYYISEFLTAQKNECRFNLENLRLQQDAGWEPED